MSKPAYIVVDAKSHDPIAIQRYRALAQEAVAKYGGRYLVRGGSYEVLEGNWHPERLVILAFPSLEAAKRFYDSPEYRAARHERADISAFEMILIEGV